MVPIEKIYLQAQIALKVKRDTDRKLFKKGFDGHLRVHYVNSKLTFTIESYTQFLSRNRRFLKIENGNTYIIPTC